jgi:hypothetical protein
MSTRYFEIFKLVLEKANFTGLSQNLEKPADVFTLKSVNTFLINLVFIGMANHHPLLFLLNVF